MPNIDKKELERISKRLMEIYEKLDGKIDEKTKGKSEFDWL